MNHESLEPLESPMFNKTGVDDESRFVTPRNQRYLEPPPTLPLRLTSLRWVVCQKSWLGTHSPGLFGWNCPHFFQQNSTQGCYLTKAGLWFRFLNAFHGVLHVFVEESPQFRFGPRFGLCFCESIS